MTATIIRRRVDLKTGETVSREAVGEKEIDERDFMEVFSICATGMRLDRLCDAIERIRKETNNDHNDHDHRHGDGRQTA